MNQTCESESTMTMMEMLVNSIVLFNDFVLENRVTVENKQLFNEILKYVFHQSALDKCVYDKLKLIKTNDIQFMKLLEEYMYVEDEYYYLFFNYKPKSLSHLMYYSYIFALIRYRLNFIEMIITKQMCQLSHTMTSIQVYRRILLNIQCYI